MLTHATVGIELVSPIMKFTQQSHWMGQFRATWGALQRGFDVQGTPQCSTHIHLSPIEGTWTLSQVKGVAKAAVYFERCIDAIVPGTRRTNNWCKSNRWNHRFNKMTMVQVFQDIDKQTTVDQIAGKMCWCSKDSPTGAALKAKEDFKHYTFRWNMASLTGAKGTIEFRQPPPSLNAEISIAWVLFAVSFARWGSQHAGDLDPTKSGRLSDLHRSVMKGAQLCAVQDTSPLALLFEKVQPLPNGPLTDIKGLSLDEIKELNRKAKEKDITLEKYKKLFGYK